VLQLLGLQHHSIHSFEHKGGKHTEQMVSGLFPLLEHCMLQQSQVQQYPQLLDQELDQLVSLWQQL